MGELVQDGFDESAHLLEHTYLVQHVCSEPGHYARDLATHRRLRAERDDVD